MAQVLHFGFILSPTSTLARVALNCSVGALYSFCFFSALHSGTFALSSPSPDHISNPQLGLPIEWSSNLDF